MAPEYALRGHYSVKSDIYSFGVLILEIITGRKNSDSFNSEESVDLLSLVSGLICPSHSVTVLGGNTNKHDYIDADMGALGNENNHGDG